MKRSFNPAKDIPDLSGKVILVTGGNVGLGKESIVQLSKHNPARIFLGARNAVKAGEAIEHIKTENPTANVVHLPLDLSSHSSIQTAVESVQRQSDRLDTLILNAGAMEPFSLTSKGIEIDMATNHVGHFKLTKLLLPLLQRTVQEHSGDVRIVSVSSEAHRISRHGIEFDQQALEKYSSYSRYGQSKLANILFAAEMARRFRKITSVAVHPGVIITDFYNDMLGSAGFLVRWALKAFVTVGPWLLSDVKAGAMNQLWAATTKKDNLKNGAYYVPVGSESCGNGMGRDEELAKKLWDWSERMIED